MPPHVRARHRQQLAAHALQVLGRVHADGVVCGFDRVNAIAVLERAKLFERFGPLERRLRKRGEFQQEGAAIAVEPDVLVDGMRDRDSGFAVCLRIPIPDPDPEMRNRRPREIQRAAASGPSRPSRHSGWRNRLDRRSATHTVDISSIGSRGERGDDLPRSSPAR